MKQKNHFLIFLFFLFNCHLLKSQLVNEYMDLQIHTTMHVPYFFFSKGLQFFDEQKPPKLSFKHQFNNVNYANYLKNNKGARIIVNGAITFEYVSSPKKARQSILKQINYVNKFAEENSIDFVVAKTPQEVRDYLKTTNKTIIIHSIEGGNALINSQEDAFFWASKGVAFITLIHLVDSEFGGAAIFPSLPTQLINMDALCVKDEEKGLTDKGKKAILWLANAGIMTDITHMSDQTRKDALVLMETYHIPPLSTHDGFKPIQHHPRSLDEEDVIKIYKNNGLVSLPISGFSLEPYNPSNQYKNKLDSLPCYCNGSTDTYKFTYIALKEFIEKKATLFYNDSAKQFNHLTEAEKVNLAIGFQSDFNGWLNHSRPRFGDNGCYTINADSTYEKIDIEGLAHPGLLESQWNLLEKEGVDLTPIKRASEKFLQLWQHFLDNKNKFNMLN